MSLPAFTIQELLDAGVHYGHRAQRWDPRMAPFIFGIRNDVHIIDLQQTVPLMHRALHSVRDIVTKGGRVLFVGTKRQAQEVVAAEAKRCGQYYVNYRWLGGMLTNWRTISRSIRRLKKMEEQLAGDLQGLTKKEILELQRQCDKLERSLGGIKDMAGLPDIIFVIDTNKEHIAIAEASRLGIPIIAVLDSNSNPDGIHFPIPGNDDALRAISMYCRLMSDAVLAGIQAEMSRSGVDMGRAEVVSVTEGAAAGEAANDATAKKAKAAPKEQASGEALAKLAEEKSTAKPAKKPAAKKKAAD
jgi:small subunit ribosomal protein S2